MRNSIESRSKKGNWSHLHLWIVLRAHLWMDCSSVPLFCQKGLNFYAHIFLLLYCLNKWFLIILMVKSRLEKNEKMTKNITQNLGEFIRSKFFSLSDFDFTCRYQAWRGRFDGFYWVFYLGVWANYWQKIQSCRIWSFPWQILKHCAVQVFVLSRRFPFDMNFSTW